MGVGVCFQGADVDCFAEEADLDQLVRRLPKREQRELKGTGAKDLHRAPATAAS